MASAAPSPRVAYHLRRAEQLERRADHMRNRSKVMWPQQAITNVAVRAAHHRAKAQELSKP